MKKAVAYLWIALVATSSAASTQSRSLKIPKTAFSCQGRSTGYYADIETGCQIYHMCDGLGRQFSYACPNTTLFQQRMLVCDHWYMVNCSVSEKDYSANLLIGQKDKPFVGDDEVHVRTPRPDILTVPYYQKFDYYGKAESPSATADNGVVENAINNEITDDQYSIPTHWSTELTHNAHHHTTPNPVRHEEPSTFTGRPIIVSGPAEVIPENEPVLETIVGPTGGDIIIVRDSESSSTTPAPEIVPSFEDIVEPPSKLFEPPTFSSEGSQETFARSSTTVRSISSFNNQFLGTGSDRSQEIDPNSREASGERQEYQPFVDFIKRFNPDEPANEINLNEQRIFEIQASSESNNGFAKSSNNIPSGSSKEENLQRQGGDEQNEVNLENNPTSEAEKPALDLLPPKTEYTEFASTTMGPPIYYEWKWAAPAFDLEPPNYSENVESRQESGAPKEGRPDFALPRSTTPRSLTSGVTARSIKDPTPAENVNDYKLGSYFIPDYVFPLDKQHPGYEEDGALTSFQVRRPKDTSHPNYGENDQCPQCHPSFVVPGTCSPCVKIRR